MVMCQALDEHGDRCRVHAARSIDGSLVFAKHNLQVRVYLCKNHRGDE